MDIDRIDELSEEELEEIAYMALMPWGGSSRVNGEPVDEDGFAAVPHMGDYRGFDLMQKTCWDKFNKNPHLNSHVRDVVGSLTGYGWTMDSFEEKVNEVIQEETHDWRNDLLKNIPKYVARSEIEGELFLALTVHIDGFVEVDFMSPRSLNGGGDYNSGIYFHPQKQTIPLFYRFNVKNSLGKDISQVFPSIYVAFDPNLAQNVPKEWKITPDLLKMGRTTSRKYKNLGYFKTFILSWDKGYLTARNLSHISTTIEWINHYENLKKWEIDHKKSAGSYLWIVKMTDSKAFRTWLKMTPEQKKESGLTAKKTPGGTLILPPGVEIDVKNPNLPNISEQDTDIMHMITSGLNKPEDMVTGQTKGDTFSGIKASRGPQSDRTQDQIAAFERFLRYDFWKGIFILKNKMTGLKLDYKVKEAFKFEEGEAKFKNVNKKAWDLIEFEFPTSEIADVEAKARAFLGVKHPSVAEVLGISRSHIAKKIGVGNYLKRRLEYATEEKMLPNLPLTAELDSFQESAQEPSLPEDNKSKPKPNKEVSDDPK
jgi:hypothetical protein